MVLQPFSLPPHLGQILCYVSLLLDMNSEVFQLPELFCPRQLSGYHMPWFWLSEHRDLQRPDELERRHLGVQGTGLSTRKGYAQQVRLCSYVLVKKGGIFWGRNFLYLSHGVNVLKIQSCLEDLYSGEDGTSDKAMGTNAKPLWKENDGRPSHAPHMLERGLKGREFQSCRRRKKHKVTFLHFGCVNTTWKGFSLCYT